MNPTEITSDKSLFIKLIISAWETQNSRVTKLLGELSDAQLLSETAPGRNRGIYLLGHLVAVSDGMLPLLGFGEKQFPALTDIFVTNPDKAVREIPTLAELKEKWTVVGNKLTEGIKGTSPDEWFTRHTAVTPEDFAKEPFRNKLNIIINRTNHMSYHLGQLVYLKTK